MRTLRIDAARPGSTLPLYAFASDIKPVLLGVAVSAPVDCRRRLKPLSIATVPHDSD